MKKKKQDVNNNYNESISAEKAKLDKKSRYRTILDNIIAGVVSAIIASAISSCFAYNYFKGSTEQAIKDINESLSSLDKDIKNEIKNRNDSNMELSNRIDDKISDLKKDFGVMEGKIDVFREAKKVKDYGESFQSLVYVVKKDAEMKEPQWNASTKIAVAEDGSLISAEELIDKYVFVSYIEDNDNEVFFYGRYNENLHWDGRCVINVYSKTQELLIITDAEYDDGRLIHYYQILPETNSSDVKCWYISDRIPNGTVNDGETYELSRINNRYKDFTYDTATSRNMIAARQFAMSLNTNIIGYYRGKTSEGKYFDNDGVLIKYSDDGTIRTYYRGNIDGYPQGYGWEITRIEESDDPYMYYEGNFEEGRASHKGDYIFKSHLTIDEIKGYVGNEKTNLLKWWTIN